MTHLAALPPDPAPLSPGAYMRKRREAAGITIDAIALALGGASPGARADVRNELHMLEDDRPGNYLGLADRLRQFVAFDPFVYFALVGFAADPASDLPRPPVCRVCGCSWSDPCDQSGRPCAWADVSQTLCTRCAAKQPANDSEARHEA